MNVWRDTKKNPSLLIVQINNIMYFWIDNKYIQEIINDKNIYYLQLVKQLITFCISKIFK